MSKVLVAYFSRAGENYFGGKMKIIEVGNTAKAARIVAEYCDSTLYEMVMKTPYSDNYKECVEQAKADLKADARPELVTLPSSISEYDYVVVAYPNYCGTIPMPVFTFLEAFDFSGKTILPLCTNEGSGLGRSVKDITRLCPGAKIGKALAITGSHADKSKGVLAQWIKDNQK